MGSPYNATAVFCFVVLSFSIWINATVLAGPHGDVSVPDDPRNSVSKHIFKSKKGWRKPDKPKNAWRDSKKNGHKRSKESIPEKNHPSL